MNSMKLFPGVSVRVITDAKKTDKTVGVATRAEPRRILFQRALAPRRRKGYVPAL